MLLSKDKKQHMAESPDDAKNAFDSKYEKRPTANYESSLRGILLEITHVFLDD
ncbi:hypothetical protein SK128_008460, partial [Halocaridina rubra]